MEGFTAIDSDTGSTPLSETTVETYQLIFRVLELQRNSSVSEARLFWNQDVAGLALTHEKTFKIFFFHVLFERVQRVDVERVAWQEH